jgi:hypothetical protein
MQHNYATHPRVVDPVFDRLDWLEDENAATANWHSRFRLAAHEQDLAMMFRPVATRRAYAFHGLILGTVTPVMIFARYFGYGLVDLGWSHWHLQPPLVFLCLMMNLVCGLVGYLMGRKLGSAALRAERRSWNQTIVGLGLIGIAWGAVTGSCGGFFFFGIGALPGGLMAMPIGLVAFSTFGILHRLLERGGMIERRHFLPLAFGITLTITALIMGVPYAGWR